MITSSRLVCLAALLALALVLSVSANAAIVAHMDDHLYPMDPEMPSAVRSLLLTCDVDLTAGIYTYNYVLQYLDGDNTVELLGIENVDNVAYTDSWNSGGFRNSTYDPQVWADVFWDQGNLIPGSSRSFSYKSTYGYREIPVVAYASGGDTAVGWTYGMAQSVPEPSSFAGLALAGFAAIPAIRRRRK